MSRLAGVRERAIWDFKSTYNFQAPKTRFEVAKDVAAFANYLGGTILVGANEDRATGQIQSLSSQDAVALKTSTGQALSDLCRPVPVADIEIISLSTAETAHLGCPTKGAVELAAINVRPYTTALIGVAARNTKTDKALENAFLFPMRTIEGTRYLRPEELALHMNPMERRALLKLSAHTDSEVIGWFDHPSGSGPRLRVKVELGELDADCLIVSVWHPGPPKAEFYVPLLFVDEVWSDHRKTVNVSFRGVYTPTTKNFEPR